jgi:WD40 repeat protein
MQAVTFDNDARGRLVITNTNNAIVLLDPATGTVLPSIPYNQGSPGSLILSSDGEQAAIIDCERLFVHFFDLSNMNNVRVVQDLQIEFDWVKDKIAWSIKYGPPLDLESDYVWRIAWSPDGIMIAAASGDIAVLGKKDMKGGEESREPRWQQIGTIGGVLLP